jgi:peptide methionine sulfoxide reductase msrA/msrB
VRIIYDPGEGSLETLMKAFFLCIDPTVADRQGNDIGSQYQTGVYFTDEKDGEILRRIFEEEKQKHSSFFVELGPLRSFYGAEEYHQNYLDKHPGGYCHITRIELEKVKALNEAQKTD